MENKNIYIPKKLRVGYQGRQDTFTGKLGYVTYIDYKGELRKKVSWEGWKSKDIEDSTYKNNPTKGFSVNREVGGTRLGSIRNEYIRVYDPRGFEIEIKVWNLLYILRNTEIENKEELVFKGKFVYGWEGSELVLIPVDAPDYEDYKKYSDLLNEDDPIKVKDLVKGTSYLTKQQEEYIYVGRHTMWKHEYRENMREVDVTDLGKYHVFVGITYYSEGSRLDIVKLKSLGRRFIKKESDTPSISIEQVKRELERSVEYVSIDTEKSEYIKLTEEDIYVAIRNRYGDSLRVKTRNGDLKLLEKVAYENEGLFYLYDEDENYYNRRERKKMSLEDIERKYGVKVLHMYLKNGNLHRVG